MSKPFAWSYSTLSSFETCPRRHNLTKITKEVVEGQSDAMAWGNKVHKALELRIKDRQPLPDTLASYEPFALSIETAGQGGMIQAEQKMALDRDFNPTGYFAKDVWARAITDVTIIKGDKGFVGDWKTGKPTPASAQLALCAAATWAYHPHLEKIVTSFVWLSQGTTTNEVYKRDELSAIWQRLMPRVTRLEQAIESGTFPPKPSGLCREWCPVPKRLCEHSGKS